MLNIYKRLTEDDILKEPMRARPFEPLTAAENIMIIDTETANTLDDALVYDFGYIIARLDGTIIKKGGYIVEEIFTCEDLMTSAYYAEKIPSYHRMIDERKRHCTTLDKLQTILRVLQKQYGIKKVFAHNALFDYKALNTTCRYTSSSQRRFMLPYGLEVWDILKLSRLTVGTLPEYKEFCFDNGFVTAHRTPRPRMTAEVIYRFLTQDTDYSEPHTSVEDVLIEFEILKYCHNMSPDVDGRLWED